jgi:hypothetical protein
MRWFTCFAALLSAAVFMAGCAVQPAALPPGSPLPVTTPSDALSPFGTTGPTLEPSSVAASPLPSTGLVDAVPGPDATIPPRVRVIPDLSVRSLVAKWEALGLSCNSDVGAFPGAPITFYEFSCVRDDAASNVTYLASAIYWTPDGVQYVTLTVLALGAGDVLDARAAAGLFFPTAALAGGRIAQSWTEGRINDPACRRSPGFCKSILGPVVLTLQVGVHGARQLDVEAAPPAP